MSRSLILVIPSLVVGLVVGFAAGFLVSREGSIRQAPAERPSAALTSDERAALVARADAAAKERDEAKKSLEEAAAEIAAARERVAALERGGGTAALADGAAEDRPTNELTDEEKRARVAELEKAIQAAEQKKDGKALLQALQELVALGAPAYPLVMRGLGRIFEDMFGENELKLVQTEVYMSISGKTWDAYYMWTLDNPDLDPEARKGSVSGLIWSTDPAAGTFLVSKLATEKDRGVVKEIMDSLAWKDPNAKEAIRDVLENRRDDKQIRMDAVNALWTIGDQVAMEALTKASQADPDPDVREAARIASRGIDPPVAGYMVNYIDEASPAGSALRRGDIILSYNGRPVANTDTLGRESRGTDGLAEVPVQIYRNGEVVNLTIRGGSIDAWGRYVKPKK